MTPLEKAVEAGNALEMSPDGYWLVSFEPSQVSAIITAFLEAAAEDDASVARGREIIANGCGCHRDCDGPDSDGYCGCRLESKAAILALKETLG